MVMAAATGALFFFVIEEGEGFAFDKPRDAEEGEEEYFENHGEVAGGGEEFGYGKSHFEGYHAPAADAVDAVADFLAGGHDTFGFGEEADAVDGKQKEKEHGTDGVECLRHLDGQLEEAHACAGFQPADTAGEEDDAEAAQAAEGGDDAVPEVVADIAYQHDGGGGEDSHQRVGLVVGGRDAPPPFVVGVGGEAGRKQGYPGEYDAEESADVAYPEIHAFFFCLFHGEGVLLVVDDNVDVLFLLCG